MKARLKPDCRFPTAVLFGGHLFTKTEWADVPAGFDESASGGEYLEFEGASFVQESQESGETAVVPDAAPAPAPAPAASGRKTSRKA